MIRGRADGYDSGRIAWMNSKPFAAILAA